MVKGWTYFGVSRIHKSPSCLWFLCCSMGRQFMEAHRPLWPHCIASAERIHVRVGSSEEKEINQQPTHLVFSQNKTLWRLREISAHLTVITMKKSLAVELCCFCKLTYESSQLPAAVSLSHCHDIFSERLQWEPGSSDTISFSKSLQIKRLKQFLVE